MPNIYTFVDTTGLLSEVFESDLNFSGNWRSSSNYYRYDVVDYGVARYVCTTANTNTAPPVDLQFTAYWSLISFTSTGTSSDVDNAQAIQDVYSLAYRAYNIALTGTDLPAPESLDWVSQWLGHTYSIAVAGTNAADMAWNYAGEAWTIAVAGTNAADQAYSLAQTALNTAWAGTSAANSADMWGRDAFSLAVDGTNAAAAATALALSALNPTYSVLPYAGTVVVDFTTDKYWSLSLTGNVVFQGTNQSAVRSSTVVVKSDSSIRTLTFPSWVFLGAGVPTSIAASKTGVLTVTAFGTSASDVIAAYAVQP